MSNRDIYEMKFRQDIAKLVRGGTAEESAQQPPFIGYVIIPTLVVSVGMAAGIFGVAIVSREFWNLYLLETRPDVIMVMLGCPLIMFGFAFGLVTLSLIPSWQRAKLNKWSMTFDRDENQPERGRILVDGSLPTQRHVSRVEWQNGGLDELSRRCHDEFGNWAAGNRIRRELFERRKDDDRSMPIFVNVTGNYAKLLQDFYDWGWTNTADVKANPRWLSKGKEDLRKRLFFSEPPQLEYLG